MKSCLSVLLFVAVGADASVEVIDLASDLTPIREEFQFPAVGAAVILEGRLHALGVMGVRKDGDKAQAEPNDAFHLGSCTKAMTGSLIGMLVQQGKLKWETPLAEYFPDLKDTMHPDYRGVTLVHLLSHRAGVPSMTAGFAPATNFQLFQIRMMKSPVEQRKRIAEIVLALAPENKPGEKEQYSNAGFTIAGVIAESVMGESYEDLLTRMLFTPLGMRTAGFGSMGTPGRTDALWGHRKDGDKIVPIEPGPQADNPPFLTPGGRVHCSMADWAKYVQCILTAARGEAALLPASCVRPLKEPPFGGHYAPGWSLHDRDWGGRVLTHSGTNTMHYAIVWVAPQKNFAVLVAANRGGDGAAEGLDRLCGVMIRKFLADQ
ncbi:MAG TPA: serine hydrolase domain-containing protein [Sedimentisphaerales bacterium]|nr:serine hydrolase domain-containing protein [Sedimentisphaerales bacterium]